MSEALIGAGPEFRQLRELRARVRELQDAAEIESAKLDALREETRRANAARDDRLHRLARADQIRIVASDTLTSVGAMVLDWSWRRETIEGESLNDDEVAAIRKMANLIDLLVRQARVELDDTAQEVLMRMSMAPWFHEEPEVPFADDDVPEWLFGDEAHRSMFSDGNVVEIEFAHLLRRVRDEQ